MREAVQQLRVTAQQLGGVGGSGVLVLQGGQGLARRARPDEELVQQRGQPLLLVAAHLGGVPRREQQRQMQAHAAQREQPVRRVGLPQALEQPCLQPLRRLDQLHLGMRAAAAAAAAATSTSAGGDSAGAGVGAARERDAERGLCEPQHARGEGRRPALELGGEGARQPHLG